MCAVQMDALVFDEASKEKADILICDLPCSGLGVMGKKTDIRYKMTAEKQKDLVQLQREILDTVFTYVKKGGTLIYSTCTIAKEENEQQVAWILENLPVKSESLEGCLPEEILKNTPEKSYVQLLPGRESSDGFFVAKFIKC